ncbi:hypothetical protein BD413DRAFT_617238 [Trametes elegans]|nr:hypothetical protein BD413DRAFT_617238 [Trametes elegans]
MSDGAYTGFQGDFTDDGTLSVTIPMPRKRKARDPPASTINLLVPLWQALRGEDPVPGLHFVSCSVDSNHEFFISVDDFNMRLPIDENLYPQTYREDWKVAQTVDSLACKGYDEDGKVLGEKGARAWPRRGLIAPNPRGKPDTSDDSARVELQAAIWREIAIKSTSAGASRLWKPQEWTGPTLKVFFVPVGSWPSRKDLRDMSEQLRAEEDKKASAPGTRRLKLTDWLTWSVPDDTFKTEDYVLLSTDLLRFYNTYISLADLQRLIDAQTQNHNDWKRGWPGEDAAKELHDKMLKNLAKTNKSWHGLMQSRLKKSSTTLISSAKSFGKRIDANKVMGTQSANRIGKAWWGSGDMPKVVAEWLHRSAYSLGDLVSANFQSPDNIVFGTFEANSDMTRAETAIRVLRDVTGATGTLETTVINTDLPDTDPSRLTYIDYMDGKPKTWSISRWIGKENYTWLAPSIVYRGRMSLEDTLPPIVWATRFHTFSRYSPLLLEGKLDSRVLSAYLEESRASRTLTSAGASDTPGPSSAHVASKATYRPLRAASPALASRPPPPTLAHDVGLQASHRYVRAAGHAGDALNVRRSGTYLTHPTTHAAWKSLVKNATHVTIGDVHLTDPHLADDGNDIGKPKAAPPATGFMLEGTIKLFGLDAYEVALQSWHGPPPPSVDIGSDVAVYQRVQLSSVLIRDLIPLLEGTQFDTFEFRNVTITYQNHRFIKTAPPGWIITADVPIDTNSGSLYRILHDVLDISGSGLTLHASVYLGPGHSWNSRPRVSSFAVQGVLDVTSNDVSPTKGIRLCDGVVLSRVGVLLFGVSVPTLGLNSKERTEYGFKVTGDMHITVPGSVTPLDFDVEIGEFGGLVDLEAMVKGGIWTNAFGTGIDLEMVQLSAMFPIGSVKSLDCSIRAGLRADSVSALLTGTFSPGRHYSVSAYVQDLGCEGIVDLFRHYAGAELSLPHHIDLTIGSATVEISKDQGLRIEVDRLVCESFTASDAILSLSSTGIILRADIESVELPGDVGLSLASAHIEVSFEKEGSGRSTEITLGGRVQLAGLATLPSITASVHLNKSAAKDLEWTVYGTFVDLGNTTTLGQLFPELRGSFLENFALQDLMFIAASRDDPAPSQKNPQKYKVRKGVQFAALFGEVDPVKKLLRRTSFPGLMLSASWSSGRSFLLDVVLPTDTMIHLGHGIATDPISLSIDVEQLLLQVSTGVQVPVAGADAPLDFEAALTVKGESVKLEGEMNGLWKDPLGIGRDVSIGPFLELGLAIDLLIFPETGLPTTFSFAGGLAIGETEGQVAVQISEVPTHELAYGQLKKFGIQDVVAFARTVTQLYIPTPPNFIAFEDVKLYISTGVTLGTTTYPAGFSFTASLALFGTHFHAAAEISAGALKAQGSVDKISIGPLQITGQHGLKPTVDLHVGATAQTLRVDGALEFLGAYVGLTVDLEILPSPTFAFDFLLHFTDLLIFAVDAHMLGAIEDLNDLSGLDFALHALFEQHLVEYVRDHVLAALETLKKTTDDEIRAAERDVKTEETKLQKGIDDAQHKLARKYASWLAHSKTVHDESQAVIDRYMTQLHSLQADVHSQRRAFNTKLKDAESALQHANAERAASMRSAEADVNKAKTKWDEEVAVAEKKLYEANKFMQEKFGSAESDIEAAIRTVDGLQSDIDSTRSRIRYCEDAPWYRFDLKGELVWLGPKLLVLEGSKATADGVLWVAEQVIKGAAFLEAKAAIPAAKELVEKAGEAGDLAFKTAEATLREVDSATGTLVDKAKDAIELVRKDGDALIRGAEYDLQKFIDAQRTVLEAALHAVDDLIHSAEWLAYQLASSALDIAKHATHALDVAKAALKAAKAIANGAINITEESIKAALGALNITRIELAATLAAFVAHGGQVFEAEVAGELVGQAFTLQLKLDMRKPTKLINDIFHA